MVALHTFMERRFSDWQDDLPRGSGWPVFFADGAAPAFDDIQRPLEIAANAPVWPGRRGDPLPGAPADAHICRAFEQIEPANVRVVVLGQDPYPAIESATGRAFEDGTSDADGKALRPALRILGQSALDLHGAAYPRGFCHGRNGRTEAIKTCFDRLARQGVLCLNTTWTYTAESHKNAHQRLWKPVTAYLLQRLVERPEGSPVFLLLGVEAQTSFDRLRLDVVQVRDVVRKCHPTERDNRYFEQPNPLQRINEALVARGDRNPVTWWALHAQEDEA